MVIAEVESYKEHSSWRLSLSHVSNNGMRLMGRRNVNWLSGPHDDGERTCTRNTQHSIDQGEKKTKQSGGISLQFQISLPLVFPSPKIQSVHSHVRNRSFRHHQRRTPAWPDKAILKNRSFWRWKTHEMSRMISYICDPAAFSSSFFGTLELCKKSDKMRGRGLGTWDVTYCYVTVRITVSESGE